MTRDWPERHDLYEGQGYVLRRQLRPQLYNQDHHDSYKDGGYYVEHKALQALDAEEQVKGSLRGVEKVQAQLDEAQPLHKCSYCG